MDSFDWITGDRKYFLDSWQGLVLKRDLNNCTGEYDGSSQRGTAIGIEDAIWHKHNSVGRDGYLRDNGDGDCSGREQDHRWTSTV